MHILTTPHPLKKPDISFEFNKIKLYRMFKNKHISVDCQMQFLIMQMSGALEHKPLITFFVLRLVLLSLKQVWNKVHGDPKRWTQLKSKRRLNTRKTVAVFQSSLFALWVDLCGLRSKLSWIRLTFSSDARGRPEHLSLHRQPICSNRWFQRQMLFLVGGWMLKQRWNARCTAVADSVWIHETQKVLCCIVAILLSTDAAARLCARWALLRWYLKIQDPSFKCYVDHSHTMYSSGEIQTMKRSPLFLNHAVLIRMLHCCVVSLKPVTVLNGLSWLNKK